MSEFEEPRGGKFSRALLGLLRFILVVFVGAMLGVAGIFCAQYVYRVATAPAKVNAQRLDGIETQQASVHGQLDERMADFNQRLAQLEASADITINDIDEIRANEDALADVVSQLDENLGGLGKLESELEIELSALRSTVAVMSTQDAAAPLTPTVTPAGKSDLEALALEVKMLKVLELLSRSRLHFLNADYGLAEKDLQNAYRVLTDLQVAGLAPKIEMYEEAMSRLKQAGRNLPASPRVAETDLEMAWDLLVEMMTNPVAETESPTMTPSPYSTSTRYPTPSTWTPTVWKSPVPTETIVSTLSAPEIQTPSAP